MQIEIDWLKLLILKKNRFFKITRQKDLAGQCFRNQGINYMMQVSLFNADTDSVITILTTQYN
jgi:hypothetical protein